jgi:mono/diheme cytochrome c family protein
VVSTEISTKKISTEKISAGNGVACCYFSRCYRCRWLAMSSRRKSDAELGLNPQQAAGRKIYDAECGRCHEPYSSHGKKGPPLKGIFQNKYLSLSGLPANDERVTDIVQHGRKEMPGYSQKFSPEDFENLLAYLHTL